MKIYVVTKGQYSDYHIVAATLDKEKAERMAKRFSDKWDECEVEEYEDGDIDFRPYWDVRFKKATSDIVRCDALGSLDECYIHDLYTFDTDINRNLRVVVAADTSEEAIKIASEKRAEYLAKKEGVC